MKGLGSGSCTRRLLVEMSAVRSGFADKKALQSTFADALLVLPVAGEQHDLLTADHSGVSWVLAFTSVREFALYGRAQGADDRQWDYLTCRGSRLRDIVSGASRGIALDVAGQAPLLLPPGWDRDGEDVRG
ncbi:SseB family protein [Nocardia vaccinii]|uniref:SseB family protein n=1 Tax=Nocardia vaccinii TaxID=1822 RepID=UPI00082FE1CF|nr:SseB family protein [Nocardia vaccinii]